MPNYFANGSDFSDLNPTWAYTSDFDWNLTATDVSSAGNRITLTASSSKSSGFITDVGIPNSDSWEDGSTTTIDFDITDSNMDIRIRCRSVMLNSSGTVLQSGSWGSFLTVSSTGAQSISCTDPTWSATEACANRFAVEVHSENLDTMMTQEYSVNWNQPTTNFTTGITEDGGTCTAPASFTPKCIMF